MAPATSPDKACRATVAADAISLPMACSLRICHGTARERPFEFDGHLASVSAAAEVHSVKATENCSAGSAMHRLPF